MKRFTLLILLSALYLFTACKSADEKAVSALAKRVMGDKASEIVFKQIPDTVDRYSISQKGDKILIQGSNSISMAAGLNRYLQQECLSNVSWYDFNPTVLPETLPKVEQEISGRAEVPYRFFLNYCTFGYTMPWWDWQQWEHFIDWMALNGVNLPLAITGQEAVWQKVWRKWGMSDEQIRAFFTGPAHLPWQRMCNLDYWEGPLPQGWIDSQAKLQKKILKRERELGMKPVLPGFSGHIPAEIAQTQPLDTFRVSYWGGFEDKYRCTFLSPMDSAFAEIQKDFLTEQTKIYGTDHIYGIDPFNEVDAPFWDPETLAKISSGIFSSLTEVDKDAKWLQMAWLFYADNCHWNKENIKAYLTAVPRGKMILLDYFCDQVPLWERTESFYGQDYIWCYLGNFGGMTGIEGDFHLNDSRIAKVKADGGKGFVGLGATLEGFGVNEPVYEAVLAHAWDNCPDTESYIDNIADRHLGKADSTYRAYWHQIADKVSKTHTHTSAASVICAHPSLEGAWHWTTKEERGYAYEDLKEASRLLEQVEGDTPYLKYDLTNTRRQLLDDRAAMARKRFTSAYKDGDREGMTEAKTEFLSICDSLAEVLGRCREFSLEKWLEDARRWGKTGQEKAYFETNARTLISVWGDSFHLWDYANRDLDGLVATYYKPRWEMFFDAVIAALDKGEDFMNSHSSGYIFAEKYGSAPEVTGAALDYDRRVWDFSCRWAGIK